jgi:hypothetical protein
MGAVVVVGLFFGMHSPILDELPADRVAQLAPMLAHGEVMAVDPTSDGRPRQVTFLGYVAAPPDVVRSLVDTPERYPEMVHNLSKVAVRREHGAREVDWTIALPIGKFDGGFWLIDRPDGAIDILSSDCEARWRFLPAEGGGTVVVEYMHYEPGKLNPLFKKILAGQPGYETGVVMAAGLMLLKAVSEEGNRRGKAMAIAPPSTIGPGANLELLLERGPVAITRSTADGTLVDVSIVKRVPTPAADLLAVARAPESWPSFIPAVSAAEVVKRGDHDVDYKMTIDGVLFNLETRFRMQLTDGGADSLGISGDLEGARIRWDLTPSADHTDALLRANYHLGDGSLILKLLIRAQPILEHGLNAGAGIVLMESVAKQAQARVARVAR